MLTLTLRSSKDGGFLARIIEQGGNVFVLDYGDRRVIDDATQRIHRGFTVFRAGQLVRAAPREPDLLLLLADYYAGEGILVSLEEPLWPSRDGTLEDRLAERVDGNAAELSIDALPRIADHDDDTQDFPTDIWSREDVDRVQALIGEVHDRAVRTTWRPPGEFDPADANTDIAPRPDLPDPDGQPTLIDGLLDEESVDDETEVVRRPHRGRDRGSEGQS